MVLSCNDFAVHGYCSTLAYSRVIRSCAKNIGFEALRRVPFPLNLSIYLFLAIHLEKCNSCHLEN